MAETNENNIVQNGAENGGAEQQPKAQEQQLERGTYEIIRNRLNKAGKSLRERLNSLNDERKKVFGSIDTKLLATERITTDHNCIPRDMIPIGGDRFLFGYNVMLGLKSVTEISDVFSKYEFKDHQFHRQELKMLADENFLRDFRELYKYYRNTQFARFALQPPHLYMVFRISQELNDIKAFKWLLSEGSLKYIDNRSDPEVRFPAQHDFVWKRVRRDMHIGGEFPHISIEDRIFVETTGGDLTIKIENNTTTGEGIYSEPVVDPDQTLDDAEFQYAIVGNLILLRIRPYQEQAYRYLVYSEKTRAVKRIDSIEHSCVFLPDDHGIIFSNGYFLQTGEYKVFESELRGMTFLKKIPSPNGEDFLFVFYNRREGVYMLLPYNLIEQKCENPIVCNGFSLFDDGEMIYFKRQPEPQKHHPIQIWQTPFTSEDYEPPRETDSYLYKIGNKEIVRGMAECHEVLQLIGKEDSYENLFLDITKNVTDILDAYYWISDEQTYNLRRDLEPIREAAQAAIAEYEKVVAVRHNTERQFKKVSERTAQIVQEVYSRRFEVIHDFVKSLADLRAVRGEIIGLRELRYIDNAAVDALEAEVTGNTNKAANRCVEFLLKPEALTPYQQAVQEHNKAIDEQKKVSDAKRLEEKIAGSASELEMLIEIVSNLKIDDATQRTTIIDNISAIFSQLNQTRAGLKNRIKELAEVEGVAEFNSQIKLLNQGVVNYIDICDTPEKCEEYLTKLMIQVEELEGRFAEFDVFVVQLAEKREEIYNAFESRKLQLVEARNKRASSLMSAADRILKGIKTRVDSFEEINQINGYFASDLMIEKVRDIVAELLELDDTVKVDDIQSRLKTIREDAVRQLKDRQDLYAEGPNIIKLGRHRFSVNTQTLDLTTVLRDGELFYHLSGTNFFEKITDPELLVTRECWTQEVVSENGKVYRGEYLAYQMFNALETGALPDAATLRAMRDGDLLAEVQRFMGPRYSEGYVKGVHDHDGRNILSALLEMDASIGLLRFHPRARALAAVFWRQYADQGRKQLIASKLKGFGSVRELFPNAAKQEEYIAELRELIEQYVQACGSFDATLVEQAGEYLFAELIQSQPGFVISARARDLHQAFRQYLDEKFFAQRFTESMDEVKNDTQAHFLLLRDWVQAFLETRGNSIENDFRDEVAMLLLQNSIDLTRVVEAVIVKDLQGMVGSHAMIENKTYRLNFNTFMHKLRRYELEIAPRFTRYNALKKELLERERHGMRLEEFRPRVLTSFVRNKLIDQVYLPLVGDNLAKQIGVTGGEKRTDRMGMLLLISPPGYGKTTLMEYIANRLGIIFMKINGPALGHKVTSLDPVEAPNAAAREEMVKLNLAFEMGDNVMIYVDDIQHCNPEFLQKFISLCDAQRKIEGVYKNRTRTYDLRGKKVCVVMAGNPYTESGEQFKIPDMLANRADTYNLGEIIGDNADVFKMSYLENSMTSNPALNKLASRSQQDVYTIIKMAQNPAAEHDELEGSYSMEETQEMVGVMRKLMRVRDVVLRVNEEYIRSAAQADAYRTEPPFKLQGSYRNMNRIAEKVVAIMNDAELEAQILSNYENDAQTLTTGAEANLLKFKELAGNMGETEQQRWDDIKRIFCRNVEMAGIGDDQKFGQLVLQLQHFREGLQSIHEALAGGVKQMQQAKPAGEGKTLTAAFDETTVQALRELTESVRQSAKPQKAASARENITAAFDQQTLSAMRELIASLQQSAKPPEAAPALEKLTAAFDEQTLTTMRQLIESLHTLSQQAQTPAPHAAAKGTAPTEAQPQSIQVVTRIPKTILGVLEKQFELMEGWLEPLNRKEALQVRELRHLRKLLEESLEKNQNLIQVLRRASEKHDDDDDEHDLE
ncbi:DNA repair ATPase [Candidatus Sumerlaeota bacterium]|nr:DNA repair ATPase [Candidatus Sumerlaeota bacterium]